MPATAPKERFDHLLERLLGENEGVFLGEYHEHPAMRQAITHLMPALKANGVKTISIELPQECIDDMKNHKTAQEWANSKPMRDIFYRFSVDTYAIAQAAEKSGIKFIGHEHTQMEPAFYARIFEHLKKEYPESERELNAMHTNIFASNNRGEWEFAHSRLNRFIERRFGNDTAKYDKYDSSMLPYHRERHEGMKARNRFAADFISKNKAPEGKLLVLGGSAHCQYGYATLHPDSAIEPNHPETGLDKLLGIPAISFEATDNVKEMGVTSGAVTHANSYTARLPEDIEYRMKNIEGISSWPPPPGGKIIPSPTDAEQFKKLLEEPPKPAPREFIDLDSLGSVNPFTGLPVRAPRPRGK